MAVDIPVPNMSRWGDYSDILQNIIQNRMNQRNLESMESLRKAQEQEAIAKSSKAQMLQQLMQSALGGTTTLDGQSNQVQTQNIVTPGGQQYNLTPEEKKTVSQLKPGESYTTPISPITSEQKNKTNLSGLNANKALMLSGALGLPTQTVEGNLITPFGTYPIGETPQQKSQREIETSYQTELGKNEAKRLDKLADVIEAGVESRPTYEAAAEITRNPVWAKLRSNPLFPNAQLEYYKRTGSPEERRMITDFQSKTNQFILDSIKKFPQRYTNRDMMFMLNLKAGDKDTLESGQAKLESAFQYDTILSERAKKAYDIATSQRIPVVKALQIADKQLNIEAIRKDIRDKVRGIKNTPTGNGKTYTFNGKEYTEEEARKMGAFL